MRVGLAAEVKDVREELNIWLSAQGQSIKEVGMLVVGLLGVSLIGSNPDQAIMRYLVLEINRLAALRGVPGIPT